MNTKIQQPSQEDHHQSEANYEDLTDDLSNRPKEVDYLDMIQKLQTDLVEKSSECEKLKIQVDDNNQDIETLSRELNECKLAMFENNEDTRKVQEEIKKSKELEEGYVKLMSDFLELGERNEHYKRNMFENYIAKTNAINNVECLMSSGALKNELDEHKLELDKKSADLNLAFAKIRNLEIENIAKDKCVNELRKTLDDAKVTHKHEITVLEDYIQSLKNTISSYEKTLTILTESKIEQTLTEDTK